MIKDEVIDLENFDETNVIKIFDPFEDGDVAVDAEGKGELRREFYEKLKEEDKKSCKVQLKGVQVEENKLR